MRAGVRPGDEKWGVDPRDAWGRLANGAESRTVPTERGAYEHFYQGVRDAIDCGAAPPVDPADSVAGLEVIEAANLSAAEGRVVTLG